MLLDAAVHASGTSKKLTSPFIPASAAKWKNTIDKNTSEKKDKDSIQAKHFSSEKRNCIIKVFPYQTACFGRLTTLSFLAAGQLVVPQTPRGRRLMKWLRCCCRPSRLLVELAAEYTPPLIVSKYVPAPGLCNLNSKTHPYWIKKGNFFLHLRCCLRRSG